MFNFINYKLFFVLYLCCFVQSAAAEFNFKKDFASPFINTQENTKQSADNQMVKERCLLGIAYTKYKYAAVIKKGTQTVHVVKNINHKQAKNSSFDLTQEITKKLNIKKC